MLQGRIMMPITKGFAVFDLFFFFFYLFWTTSGGSQDFCFIFRYFHLLFTARRQRTIPTYPRKPVTTCYPGALRTELASIYVRISFLILSQVLTESTNYDECKFLGQIIISRVVQGPIWLTPAIYHPTVMIREAQILETELSTRKFCCCHFSQSTFCLDPTQSKILYESRCDYVTTWETFNDACCLEEGANP